MDHPVAIAAVPETSVPVLPLLWILRQQLPWGRNRLYRCGEINGHKTESNHTAPWQRELLAQNGQKNQDNEPAPVLCFEKYLDCPTFGKNSIHIVFDVCN